MFSDSFKAAVKDEPPDNWDEEDQEEEKKEKPLRKDKDLEFLFQEVVRDSSMDEYLKKDLHSKQSESKYKEMLVSVFDTYFFPWFSKSWSFLQ